MADAKLTETDYCETKQCADEQPPAPSGMGWKELYLKEDWWATWLGLGIVLAAYFFFAGGSSMKWIAIARQNGQPSANWAAISPITSASTSPSLSSGW